jgi:hypothetical protein
MTKLLRSSLVLLALLALFPVTGFAQAAPTDKFGWDQTGATLAVVQAYRYDLEMDGIVLSAPLVQTCTGAASPFTCLSPIPALVPGPHTARIRAVDVTTPTTPVVGPFSAPLAFSMRAVPAAPGGLRIVPGGAGGVIAGNLGAFEFGAVAAPGEPR